MESTTIKQLEIKEKFLKKDYLRQTRKLLKTKFGGRNIARRTNNSSISLVRYRGNFLECTKEELQQMDQRTRELITTRESLYQRDDIDKLYVSRKERGRGLACLEDSLDSSIRRLVDYIKKSKRRIITQKKHKDQKKKNWEKEIVRKTNVSTFQTDEISHQKRETEPFLIAIQDNVIVISYVKTKLDKTQQNSNFKLYGDRKEIINHIIRESSALAQNSTKLDAANWRKGVQREFCKKLEFDHSTKWYLYKLEFILDNDTHEVV